MRKISVFVLIAALFVVMSCDSVLDSDDFRSTQYRAENAFSFQVDPNSVNAVDVDAINGSVRIVGADSVTAILVEGTKQVKSDSESDAVNYLQYLSVSIGQQGSTLTVESEYPSDTNGREVQYHYVITVPKSLAAAVDLTNGQCYFDDLENRVDVDLTNGDVLFTNIVAAIEAEVTNGQISGAVDVPANKAVECETTNGQIVLQVPQALSARVYAQVTNGTVHVNGLNLTNMTSSSKKISGTAGSGAGELLLKTTNGNIDLTTL